MLLLLALAGYSAWVLGGTPCRGVADNLDHFRVTQPAGIEPLAPPPSRPGVFVECRYGIGRADLGKLFSSASLFAWVAKHLPYPGPPGEMALQQMGILWLALWLALVAGLVGVHAPLPALLAVFAVLADPGYLLFWNSFYGDGALLFALAGAVAVLTAWANDGSRIAHLSRGRWLVSAAVLVALGFVGSWSKMQYFPFAAVLALSLAPLFASPPTARIRMVVTALVLGVVAAGAGWHFYFGGGPRFPWANNYHAVYGGLVRVSSAPDTVFDRLDVPERFRDLPQRDVFGRVPPDHPVHAELADLSRLRLLALYAGDTAALRGVAWRVQTEMARPRTHTRGNYPASAERLRKTAYDPTWRFARVRSWLLAPRPWLLWPFLAAVAVACAAAWSRGASAAARTGPFVLLLAWFSCQVVAVVLGDGFVAFEQHVVGARMALDLLIALSLVEVAGFGARAFRRRVTADTGARLAAGGMEL